eukprot:scaffold43146_cov73-Phaeocystis_antarctica.AAC.1
MAKPSLETVGARITRRTIDCNKRARAGSREIAIMSTTNVRVGVAIWSRASGVSSSTSRRKRCRGRHSASTPIGCDSVIAASMPAPSCERLLASSTSKHGDVGGGAYATVVPVFVGD